jgi:hypothetical protein
MARRRDLVSKNAQKGRRGRVSSSTFKVFAKARAVVVERGPRIAKSLQDGVGVEDAAFQLCLAA